MRKMSKMILFTAAVAAAVSIRAADWKVPNWTTIVTEPGAVERQIDGKTWCGHCQGMCVSSNALYFSFHNQIVKTDWYGRLLKRVEVDRHSGDICWWNGRVYTGVWLKPKKGSDEKWCAAICVYDADTLDKLNERRMPWNGGADGITCLDGVIYLALGGSGKYDLETKCGRRNWFCRFDADTLEQIGEPFSEDHGDDSCCGAQNMATDGKYIYASHYTADEAARTPNVVVHDKDDFHVVAKYRFGWNHGLDVVPGGRGGAVRFAWVLTPNWTHGRQDPPVPVVPIVQFVEVKDGQALDFTEHGFGFRTTIER